MFHTEHRHSGIGFMTPETVHYGRAGEVHKQRTAVLDTAFARHPKRFKGVAPQPPELPTAAWINPPQKKLSPRKPGHGCTLNYFHPVSHFH